MGDFNVDILKKNNHLKNKQELFISWINSNKNHNLVKAPQKLDLN